MNKETVTYTCKLCQQVFFKAYDLRKHGLVHCGEEPYPCDKCDKIFLWKSHRTIHYKDAHNERQYGFQCDVCKVGFTLQSNLKKHSREHSKEKIFHCDICTQRFSTVKILQRHQIIHTGEEPYNCEFCGKQFLFLRLLQQHEFTHKEKKPYSCQHCGKLFQKEGDLKRHEYVHGIG